jgi:hypothetical protein
MGQLVVVALQPSHAAYRAALRQWAVVFYMFTHKISNFI